MSWAAVAIGGSVASGFAPLLANMGKDKRLNKQARSVERIADRTMGKMSDYTSGEVAGVKDSIGDIRGLYDVFGQEANRSYLDTTEGKSFMSMIDERSRKNKDSLRENINLMGGTTESFLAGLDKINQQEGSSTRDLVAGSDQRRSNIRGAQSGLLAQILNANQGLLANKTGIGQMAYGFGSELNEQNNQQTQAMMNALQKNSNNSMDTLFSSLG